MARCQLPVGRPDLPDREPAPARAPRSRAREAAPARPLRHRARPEPDLRPHEPGHPRARRQGHLHHRARARRPRPRGERVSRGPLQRGLPRRQRGRGGHAPPVPPVLVPRRDPEPRRSRDARVDPRGRRARLLARARLRRRVRQPRPPGRVRRRRRRGRDRRARDELALEQVPEPSERRRRPPHPPPERLQDRQPDGARPDPQARAGCDARGPRLAPDQRDGRLRRRADRRRPRAVRRGARRRARRHRGDPVGGPRQHERQGPGRLADDRPAKPQRLDRPEGARRPSGRELMALASGARPASARQEGAPAGPRGLDAELPARGALRRRRHAAPRPGGPQPDGHEAHERDPAGERRRAPARPDDPRLPPLRRRRALAGHEDERGHAGPGRADPRRHRPKLGPVQGVRPRRDLLEPAGGGVRGRESGLGG